MLSDIRYRLRALFRRSAMDSELDAELSFHIEQHVAKLMRGGMPRAEAERRARMEFGGVEQIREDTRRERGVAWLDAVRADVRYAWRGLRSRPGFAAAVVLTLGLGIGANATMFGVVDRLLLRPSAYLKDADRVHRVYWSYTWNGRVVTARNFAYRHYMHLQEHTRSFDEMAAFSNRTMAIGAGGDTRELPVTAVSATFFEFFNARPALGRFFTPEEDAVPAGQRVAVLGYGHWQTAYGGRSDVIGEQVRAGEVTYTVIGVAPDGFVGMADRQPPVLFVPITAMAHGRVTTYAEDFSWEWLEVLARRRPDISVAQAETDLTAAFVRTWDAQRQIDAGMPPAAEARPMGIVSAVQFARGPDAGPDGRVAAWVMGVALIVLVIACANVMNLLLVRAVGRRREVGLRLALGVSRRRLVQQLLTETALLALLGGAAGLALAHWGGATLRALFLTTGETAAVATDGRTLLFTAGLTLGAALLTGLAPAAQGLRADVGGVLRAGMAEGAYRSSRARSALLLVQGALCVVLLVGAGLFLRSLMNVRAFRLGYDTEALVIASANRRGTVLTQAQANAVAEQLVAAAATVPGVSGATLVASIPFYSFEGRGTPYVPGRDSLNLLGRYTLQIGSPSYFETVGTRILRGRGFTSADVAGAQPVVVVSQAMADAIWPGADAVGRQLRIGPDSLPMLTVVGIAENISGDRIGGTPEFWYYLSADQYRQLFGSLPPRLFVRVRGDPVDFIEVLRVRLQQEMPGEAYVTALPLQDVVAPRQRSWRLGATMFVLFAGLALVLAAVGLYSVIAYAVAQRTRELGVRIALGASVMRVVRMVVAQGALFALGAVLAGGAIAWFAVRWIEPLLFSVPGRDPLVFGGVAAALVIVALAATAVPAWRATRVDPTIALKAE